MSACAALADGEEKKQKEEKQQSNLLVTKGFLLDEKKYSELLPTMHLSQVLNFLRLYIHTAATPSTHQWQRSATDNTDKSLFFSAVRVHGNLCTALKHSQPFISAQTKS